MLEKRPIITFSFLFEILQCDAEIHLPEDSETRTLYGRSIPIESVSHIGAQRKAIKEALDDEATKRHYETIEWEWWKISWGSWFKTTDDYQNPTWQRWTRQSVRRVNRKDNTKTWLRVTIERRYDEGQES